MEALTRHRALNIQHGLRDRRYQLPGDNIRHMVKVIAPQTITKHHPKTIPRTLLHSIK